MIKVMQQNVRVALHFCDVTLSAKKLLPEAYPKALQTLGDHLRKRRLDLKLYQKDVAEAIGVDTLIVCNWENNLTNPRLYLLPQIFQFLGFNPLKSNATSLREKIKQYRIQRGLSLRKLAKELGIDPGTVAKWERGRSRPRDEQETRLRKMLKG
jgi:transcriptional regulator with XRE-family HTH domain